jgi:ketosteroid isomerase-like protein
VQNTDDVVEVLQLLARYAFALDSHDPEGEAACYTRDGTHVSPVQNTTGHAALIEAAKKRIAGMDPSSRGRHMVINPQVTLDGDNGTVRTYYMGVANKDGKVVVHNTGEYHIKVRKEDGQWKLQERAVALDAAPVLR